MEIESILERKPCPACKAQNVFVAYSARAEYNIACWHVQCRFCEMRGPIRYSDAEAIAAWNALPRSQPNNLAWEERHGADMWKIAQTLGVREDESYSANMLCDIISDLISDSKRPSLAPAEPATAQCCMCGKTGLSTIEGDGGTECELSDGRWTCSPPDQDAEPSEAVDIVQQFMAAVEAELRRARTKFPGDRIMTIALAEEFGELAKAMLDEPQEAVWKEAVQTAVMAARVAIDGDNSVDEWRAAKGLDNHRAALSVQGAKR